MNLYKSIFILPFITVLIFFTGCALAPMTASVNQASTKISFFNKQGQKPVVVFQSGLGDGKTVWKKVVAKMPDNVSIFSYDRPGYGNSPETTNPRDPCTIARELDSVLTTAKIEPPYLLVGHSLGGLYMFCYAKLYPEKVAGLVLLDPTHPYHWARMKEDAPTHAALINGLKSVVFSKIMKQEFNDQEACLNTLNLNSGLESPAVSFLFSGQFKLEERGPAEQMVRNLRKEWMLLFENARSTEISDSGHYIQKDDPDRVIQAIQFAIEEWQISNKAQFANGRLHIGQ